MPATNVDFWQRKFAVNTERDLRSRKLLAENGLRVLIIWECETRDEIALETTLAGFLNGEN